MTFLKLLTLILLPLLPVANARSLDGETVQELLKDVDEFTDELACLDCKQIIEIFKHLLSDKEFQVKLKNTLEILCDELPDAFATSCRRGIDASLPTAVTFLTGLMIPDQVCTDLGLCESDLRQQVVKEMLMDHIQKIVALPTLESSIQCGICTYVLNLLPRARTERALIVVLSEACSFLPFLIRGQCSQITQKYIRMIFEELLNPESPKSICSLLHLCQSLSTGSSKAFSPLSDCDTCLTLAVLARLTLGSNATQPRVTSFLGSVCQVHPEALPECTSFTQSHGQQLQSILGKDLATLDVCQSADLCVRRERADDGDPCALGPRFACRNVLTAYTCGLVSFCQKNMWK